MKPKKKIRIELIDIAKAITIFLVILGHTTGNRDTPMYRRLLYAFHMPLFFVLAGMSIRPAAIHGWEAWKSFLRKNILALIVPYLIWAFVYAPFSFDNVPRFLYGSWEALGNAQTLTSLWYLTAFFVARILMQCLFSLFDKLELKNVTRASGICAVPLFVVGFLFPKLQNGYPWCFNVAFVAAGFIMLGVAFRTPILILAQQEGWVLGAVFAGSLGLLLGGTVLRGDALELSLMCGSEYGNIFWFLLNSVSGTMSVLSASMLLQRLAREGSQPFSTAAVSYIGQHTLGIFLLHKNMLQMLILPWIRSWLPGPDLLTAFVGSCVALAGSMVLCTAIERYVPQLLGQFPKYQEQPAA
ncbi:MAG: acyltransferase family protein [Clostridia bacterium]|nr:acyltransferase family protein [Clostridia bacterium]